MPEKPGRKDGWNVNQRENLLALLRREPYEWVPAEFSLCPSLEEEYRKRTGGSLPYRDFF